MTTLDLRPEQCATIDQLFQLAEQGDHYALLRVTPEADARTVQKAFHELSRTWHPDRFYKRNLGPYAEKIELIFVAMNHAAQTLRDPERRKAYDRELREAGRMPRAASPPAASTPAAPPPSAAPGAASPPPRTRPGSIRERLEARGARPGPGRGLRERAEAAVRERLKGDLEKARAFHQQALQDRQEGRPLKAVSAVELALQYDPDNEALLALREDLREEARRARLMSLVSQAEQAETFGQARQALQLWRDATALDPEDGRPFFRLARLIAAEEPDAQREVLNHLRMAVIKEPNHLEFRLALAELYARLGMKLNARRDYEAVLRLDPKNAAAREALKAL